MKKDIKLFVEKMKAQIQFRRKLSVQFFGDCRESFSPFFCGM